MSREITEIIEELLCANPDAILLEPRALYDSCIVGTAFEHDDDWWSDARSKEGGPVFVYDYDKMVAVYAEQAREPIANARLHIEFLLATMWDGDGTPIVVTEFVYEQDDDGG